MPFPDYTKKRSRSEHDTHSLSDCPRHLCLVFRPSIGNRCRSRNVAVVALKHRLFSRPFRRPNPLRSSPHVVLLRATAIWQTDGSANPRRSFTDDGHVRDRRRRQVTGGVVSGGRFLYWDRRIRPDSDGCHEGGLMPGEGSSSFQLRCTNPLDLI